jgi:hypothetical protein
LAVKLYFPVPSPSLFYVYRANEQATSMVHQPTSQQPFASQPAKSLLVRDAFGLLHLLTCILTCLPCRQETGDRRCTLPTGSISRACESHISWHCVDGKQARKARFPQPEVLILVLHLASSVNSPRPSTNPEAIGALRCV